MLVCQHRNARSVRERKVQRPLLILAPLFFMINSPVTGVVITQVPVPVTTDGHSLPARACYNGGVTGFNLYSAGYYGGNWGYGTGSWYKTDVADLLTSDVPWLAQFKGGGQYEKESFNNNAGADTSYFSVRYVKK